MCVEESRAQRERERDRETEIGRDLHERGTKTYKERGVEGVTGVREETVP